MHAARKLFLLIQAASVAALITMLGCGRSPPPAPPAAVKTAVVPDSLPNGADPSPGAVNPPAIAVTPGTETSSQTPEIAGDAGAKPPPISADGTKTTSQATAAPRAEPAIPGERLLVYTPGGPLIIEVFVTFDGQPFAAARNRMLQQILQAADGDGNSEATWEELWADAQIDALETARNPSQNDAERDRRRRNYDRNGDDQVSQTEAEQLLTRLVGPPTALNLMRSNLRDLRSYRSQVRDLLDDDGDSYLSAAEWQAAPDILARRDADRDELVDLLELSDTAVTPDNPQAPDRNMSYESDLPPQAELLDSRVLWSSVWVTLRELYLSDGELGPGSFPLTPGLFTQLDLNQNRRIDKDEITRLASVSPHLQIDLRYGRTQGQEERFKVRSISSELSGAQTNPLPDGLGVQVELPGVKLQLRAQDFAAGQDSAAMAKEALQQLDKDQNGYLEAGEAAENERFGEATFKAIDANADGKLFPDEIEKYLDSQQQPVFNRVQVEAANPDDALFAALDTNGDNRLGPREVLASSARLNALDANGDGKIMPDEVTSAVMLSFDRAETQANAAPRVNRQRATAIPPDPKLPRWFVGMDRNADGDLSSAEFLGTPQQFSRLDTNTDGFISGDEAQAASTADTAGDSTRK